MNGHTVIRTIAPAPICADGSVSVLGPGPTTIDEVNA